MTHVPSLAERTVAELLARWPQLARVFVRHRMACVGCAIAPFESVAEVAAIYHLPVERFTDELQRVIAASGNRRSRQSRRGGRRGGRR
jgi:hybrid cluster-associated redox disulfide protein